MPKTSPPSLTSDQLIEQGDYLKHNFDVNSLTKAQLAGVLDFHGVQYPTSHAKRQLVHLFTEQITANSSELMCKRLGTNQNTASGVSRGGQGGTAGHPSLTPSSTFTNTTADDHSHRSEISSSPESSSKPTRRAEQACKQCRQLKRKCERQNLHGQQCERCARLQLVCKYGPVSDPNRSLSPEPNATAYTSEPPHSPTGFAHQHGTSGDQYSYSQGALSASPPARTFQTRFHTEPQARPTQVPSGYSMADSHTPSSQLSPSSPQDAQIGSDYGGGYPFSQVARSQPQPSALGGQQITHPAITPPYRQVAVNQQWQPQTSYSHYSPTPAMSMPSGASPSNMHGDPSDYVYYQENSPDNNSYAQTPQRTLHPHDWPQNSS